MQPEAAFPHWRETGDYRGSSCSVAPVARAPEAQHGSMRQVTGCIDQPGHLFLAKHGRQSPRYLGVRKILSQIGPLQRSGEEELHGRHALFDRVGSQDRTAPQKGRPFSEWPTVRPERESAGTADATRVRLRGIRRTMLRTSDYVLTSGRSARRDTFARGGSVVIPIACPMSPRIPLVRPTIAPWSPSWYPRRKSTDRNREGSRHRSTAGTPSRAS